jgi:hypothetical protein
MRRFAPFSVILVGEPFACGPPSRTPMQSGSPSCAELCPKVSPRRPGMFESPHASR